MADEKPKLEYPPDDIPVVYFDTVGSASWDQSVVKVYLARVHPEMNASGPGKPVVVTEMIMPIAGFVGTAFFFDRLVKRLVEQNYISQEQVDRIREAWSGADANR